jgi:hypothetical protein
VSASLREHVEVASRFELVEPVDLAPAEAPAARPGSAAPG